MMLSPLLKPHTAAPETVDMKNVCKTTPWTPKTNERILVIAPHPDDETLAAGGVITAAQQLHHVSDIRVAVATNGDASYTTALFYGSHVPTMRRFRSMAVQRQKECLAALNTLGITLSQVRFWGFPDRGLSQLQQNYWGSWQSYRSPTTGFRRAEQAIYSPALQYNGRNLLRLIQSELVSMKPTTIIFPHPHDAHPDHRTLALLTLLAVAINYRQQTFPQMLSYLTWTKSRGFREKTDSQSKYKVFALSDSIQELKANALERYRSQRIAAGFLLKSSAKTTQEVFVAFS